MKSRTGWRKFLYENSLSLVMFGLFGLFFAGLMVTGWMNLNDERQSHAEAVLSFWQYATSGEFVEAVFENWESEFLQMGALVVLTIWLRQKGAPDSKKLGEPHRHRVTSRLSLVEKLYSNSLSLALFSLFIMSFTFHVLGGTAAYNHEAAVHGEATVNVWQYLGSSQFWFESFQNWQSEFLSIGTLLVLSVFLRQRNSPESKPVDAPNSETGGK